jgi:N-acetylneuraminate synthase
VIEFHLAERDFQLDFERNGTFEQEMIIHAPEYMGERLLDLCAEDETVRAQSVALVQKTADLARALALRFNGKPKVIVHPGAMSLKIKLEKERLHNALIRSLEEMDGHGVDILLENLPPYPWYFGGQWKGNYFMDAEEISAFCEKSGARVCFDLSHAALYCNAKEKDLVEYIKVVAPYVEHIHFSDAYGLDGEGMQIDEGDIDFEKVMPLFAEYDGTWVPEIWRGHLHGGRGFLEALVKLQRYDL